MKTIAILPLRGGSKGVLQKNLKLLGGKPLYTWALDALSKTPEISEIYISTDDNDIKRSLFRWIDGGSPDKNIVVIDRPSILSSDTATTVDTVLHTLWEMDVQPETHCLVAQATSPFTKPEHFSKLLKQIGPHYSSAAFTLPHYHWNYEDDIPENGPRQNRTPKNMGLGNGWAFLADAFYKERKLLTEFYELIPLKEQYAVEIDSLVDFYVAEGILNFIKETEEKT